MIGRMIYDPVWIFPAVLVGYLLGSLPLGSLLIRKLSGRDAGSFAAHNMGVENVMRFVGARIAIAAFLVDVLKGYLAVALLQGNPWAALGVFAGHLYPLPIAGFQAIPRGRGNGVLLGVLAALVTFSLVPFPLALIAVALFAIVLGVSRYVSIATLAALAGLLLVLLLGPFDLNYVLPGAGLLLLAAWRHKSSLARVLDGTETRLGDPPPVLGSDPRIVRAAFMVHPLTIDDLWQPLSLRWLGWLYKRGIVNEARLRKLLPHIRPLLHGEFKGIELPDGRELRVQIITGALLPDMITGMPEVATRMAIRGAEYARDLGAEAFGLGAFWSVVGQKGLDVQAAVPGIAITNGGAYTAATVKAAVPGLLDSFREAGGRLEEATAAVIGANGVVAFGVARTIAGEVGSLILIGRDLERLQRSADTLQRKHSDLRITVSTEIDAAKEADLIFTATSDPNPVIYARHVKPGAWIFDIGRPFDADESVRQVEGVHVVPGGVVRPPGPMDAGLVDIHFGQGMVPACMAETMIMTATRDFDKASLGAATRSASIDYYLREGERLGFEIITRDEHAASA